MPLRVCWPSTGRKEAQRGRGQRALRRWRAQRRSSILCETFKALLLQLGPGEEGWADEMRRAQREKETMLEWSRLDYWSLARHRQGIKPPRSDQGQRCGCWNMMFEAQRCGGKKSPKKCPHIVWLCHANQRHRRFKKIYQTSCFSKTIVMNMTPPSYPRINRRTDISNSIFCADWGNFAKLCLS